MLASRSFAYLSAVLSFAYVERWTILGIPTTTLELSLLATFAVYAGEKIYWRERPPNPLRMPYSWPLALLLLAATISVFVPVDKRAAAGIWKAYFLEPMVFAYILADVLRRRRDLEKLIGYFFIAGVIVSVFQLLVFVYALGIHRPRLVEQPPVMLYFSPNATGLFLGPLMAMAAALVIYGNRSERTRSVFFLVFALPALLLSFSRGAWLGVVLAVVLLLAVHRRRLLLLPALAVALGAAVLVPAVRRRIATELDPNDPFNSVNARRDLWRATLEMMRTGRHPLLGTGLSGFKHDIAPFKSLAGYSEDLIYPHNVFLNFWTETGLLGVAAFTWLAVEWVRQTWRSLRRPSPLRPYYLAVAAASVAFITHGMLDVPFFKNDLALLTLSIIGLQVAALRQDEAGGRGRSAPTGTSPTAIAAEIGDIFTKAGGA